MDKEEKKFMRAVNKLESTLIEKVHFSENKHNDISYFSLTSKDYKKKINLSEKDGIYRLFITYNLHIGLYGEVLENFPYANNHSQGILRELYKYLAQQTREENLKQEKNLDLFYATHFFEEGRPKNNLKRVLTRLLKKKNS